VSDVVSPRKSSWGAVTGRFPSAASRDAEDIILRLGRTGQQMRLPGKPEGLSLLAGTLIRDLWSAGLLVEACVLTGAIVAIILVMLAGKDHRVDAIHATADLLSALMPWRARHRKD